MPAPSSGCAGRWSQAHRLLSSDLTVWGPNKMIGIQEPDPSLNEVYKEAKDAGSIKWLRWQMVAGTQVAVFRSDRVGTDQDDRHSGTRPQPQRGVQGSERCRLHQVAALADGRRHTGCCLPI